MLTETLNNSYSGDGYGRGEGFATAVLRRLNPSGVAHILIRGSAVNQDGRSGGLTAPNGPSQTALIG
jgi:acyl transferase domain-containing protein